ncbi:DUF6245 family protein [Streptosporangium sp. NPDC002544]|uniref:DUF6245 family protein n=1 Tax=Streptosporangium sp. NPDC002544 TaxID=3154538 RepID=UPI00332884CE
MSGTRSEAHASEAARLGGPEPYRMQLANALLGAVQVEAMLAESAVTGTEDLAAAHREQLVTAGVADDPDKLVGFLRWQALRVAGPLRLVAQDPATGPIPLAAAHAAEGLQKLLGVVGAGQVPDVETVTEHVAEMAADQGIAPLTPYLARPRVGVGYTARRCRQASMRGGAPMDPARQETGEVTGTKDANYNLIWFVEQCLSNVLRLETYIADAERAGDPELADLFRRAQAESRKGAEQGKQYLRQRLTG